MGKNIPKIPLTDSQTGIYLDCAEDQDNLKYNITCEWSMSKEKIDRTRLLSAIEKAVENHLAFRTTVIAENGVPYMREIREKNPVLLQEMTEAEYSSYRDAFAKPFVLDGSFLYRIALITTEEKIHVLLDIHHLLFDGSSLVIFENEFKKAYEGEEIEKEERTLFEESQKNIEEGKNPEMQKHFEFYEKYLADLENTSGFLPDICDKSEEKNKRITDFVTTFSAEKAVAFAKKTGISENILFAASFAYTLAKFTAQKDVTFASVESGRHLREDLRATTGLFVTTFPVRIAIEEDKSVQAFLTAVKENFFSSLKNDKASFVKLAAKYGISSATKFVYQGNMLNDFKIGDSDVVLNVLEDKHVIGDFDVMILKENGRYVIKCLTRKSLYSQGYVESIARTINNVAEGFLTKEKLSEIDLLDAAQMEEEEGLQGIEKAYDERQTVVSIFREQVQKTSEHVAISFAGKEYSYRDFDILTDKVARFVREKGIGKDDFVAILVGRNEFMPIAAWGVVKAGAGYQPLDPSYPSERLSFMVRDSKTKLLICDRNLRGMLDGYDGEVLYTDAIENLPKGFEDVEISPHDALIIIYTSGTTGTPKGCVLEHKNIVCFHYNHTSVMGIDTSSKVAQYASFGFDAGVMDIFTTLMAGATLCIVPEEVRLDLNRLNEFYVKNGITHGFMTTQVGRMFAEKTTCRTLRALLLGGEKLVPFNPPKGFRVVNGYGPSETIAYVTHFEIRDDGLMQPIGKPNGNTKLYVVDQTGRRMPVGACGELCIAGNQVGRGYLGREEKTKEVFVANPFCEQKGYDRMYRTGDVVRLLVDGNFDFVGRRDGQVKIRGFRIELTEVEQVLRSCPGVENATVQAFDEPSGGKYLVAYVTSSEKIDEARIRECILQQKPAYMVPAVILQIDAVPVNVNGKVDKKKLPVPQRKTEKAIPPSTATERVLFTMLSEILGSNDFGVETDMFAVGLSSVGSLKLNAELFEKFGVPCTIRDLKQQGTVRNLALFVDERKKPTEPKRDLQGVYPLTKTQEGIYFECAAHPDTTTYNIPFLLAFDTCASVSVPRLKSAVVQALRTHPCVDSVLFLDENGKVCQKRRTRDAFSAEDIPVRNVGSITDALPTLVKPFSLLESRLFRIEILRDAEKLYLFFDFHHILCDGASFKIFLEDVDKAYHGEKVPEESYTGYDKALDEDKQRSSDAYTDAEEYYRNLLGGLDTDYLPRGDVHAYSQKGSGSLRRESEKAFTARLQDYLARKNLGANAFFCTVFGYVLSWFNGSESSVFTTVYNGRNDARLERTFSMLVKTLPVVGKVTDSVEDSIRQTSHNLLDGMTNDLYSFAEISRTFGLKNDVMFIYQGERLERKVFCDGAVSEVPLGLRQEKAPFVLQVELVDGKVRYTSEFDGQRYTDAYVRSFLQTMETVADGFLREDDLTKILLASEEQIREAEVYNQTERAYDADKNVIDVYRERVKEFPDKTAVSFGKKRYSYREFDKICNKIAAFVQTKGIGKDDFVAILVGRNEFMPIAAWGVVLAGAGYQPLDPSYPADRLNYMVQDSGAKLLIVDRCYQEVLSDYSGAVLFTDEIETLPEKPLSKTEVSPDSALLIIYTSGTTGLPKGCVLEHKNIVCFYYNHTRVMDIDSSSKVAQYASFGFDAGAMDIFTTVMAGATLCIIPDEIRLDLSAINRFYVENEITQGFMTTQVARMFAEQTTCKTLKRFTFGGEKLVPFRPQGGFKVINGYGPSETMAYVTSYDVLDDNPMQPIGVASGNTKLYVVGSHMRRIPIGACGELCIAGNQVGRGYLNKEEKTKEVFVQNPFCSQKGYTRMYRTGDVVRLLPDGNFDFVGRRDGQVKIRGFRVELTEVEQVIRTYRGIENATVQAFDEPSGGKFLAAYVTSREKIDTTALHAFIAKEKPAYMVPAVTMQIDRIPVNVNGKVDKRKLPVPVRSERAGVEPCDEVEKKLCAVYGEILGLSKVYADDDFFTVGGTSVSALQLVTKLEKIGYNIVFKNVFENTTPQQLASFLHGHIRKNEYFAPTGKEREKHDYSALRYNVVSNLDKICSKPLGNVLLTGVTGFLGSHVFMDLLDNTQGKIICIVRDKKEIGAIDRLNIILEFYFERTLTEKEQERVLVVSSDLSDKTLSDKLKDIPIDTILNCAANVKHFGSEASFLKDNAETVDVLIDIALRHHATLVQASSLSVSGESVDHHIPDDLVFAENMLNIGQSLENLYCRSKYFAEEKIIDAVSKKGLRAKIIRFGNLMARLPDGEFQINTDNNGFLRLVKGYATLGCYPVEELDAPIEFSPIDYAARAMRILAGTPEEFTCFHANNCHRIHFANVFEAFNRIGIPVEFVPKEEFLKRYKAMLDAGSTKDFSGLLAYKNTTDEKKTFEEREKVPQKNDFTTKALYRLGFSWPIIEFKYLEQLLRLQKESGFFET